MSPETELSLDKNRSSRQALGLGFIFGAMYFVQGIAEPTEGLIAQPVRSLLKTWDRSAGEIALFMGMLGAPWSLKMFYGLLVDFLPGVSRRTYLLVVSGLTTSSLAYLYFVPPPPGAARLLFAALLIPTVGVAFADVVVDALMVEKGQKLGLTGRLQSIQWASMYAATILAGLLGGYVSQRQVQEVGFLVCAIASGFSWLITWKFVRPEPPPKVQSPRKAFALLARTFSTPSLLAASMFLFLWNFNPFSSAVLHHHMTEHLGLSEQFYGVTTSVFSVAALLASVAYAFYCRKIAFRWLVHGSIVLGILSTVCYWGLVDEFSGLWIAFAVGFTYMTASLVQLDLAARVCLPETAAFTFALLMSLCNISISLSTGLGGPLYDVWSNHFGETMAFNLLVAVGAGLNALCWLVLPWLTAPEE